MHHSERAVAPWIFGPPLDGSPGVRALPVGRWLGWFGLSGPWQQAVGPMQFLPATFTASAVDQDGDGVANPHDIDDAVATAANYHAVERTPLSPTSGLRCSATTTTRATFPRCWPMPIRSGPTPRSRSLVRWPARQPSPTPGLAPRSGGRQHKGVDIFAAYGTPVVAPVAGDVELGEDPLGGLSFDSGETTATSTTAPSGSVCQWRRTRGGKHRDRLRRAHRQRRRHRPTSTF